MRRSLLLVVPAFALCCMPSLMQAQFQEPTKEELQMTSDPKAPGAAAVYLYREETVDDSMNYHSLYVRLKILTEKGKEEATVHVPYEHGTFKVSDIQGRTIHSDGTVIPLTAKPSDLTDVKAKGFEINTMVFTLPSVEVGSILEYRLQLRYENNMVVPPHWDVQQRYFVHKAHYAFIPPQHIWGITNSRGQNLDRLMWIFRAGPKDKIVQDARGYFSFDTTDVPPIPNDDWMPPLNSINWRVYFYYTPYSDGGQFWQQEGKFWIKDADHFANPSKALQEAVGGIVAASDSDDVKARKIYGAVMKLENTRFTRTKTEAERKKEKLKDIKTAEDVWKQQSGSANEIALLYVALAKAAGLHAYPMQIVNRDDAMFDPTFLSSEQLDDYIAVVDIGGKEIYLDPGQKACPFGLLQWKHTLAGGLRGSDKGPGYGETPATTYKQNVETRVADLNIDEAGNVSGTVRFVLSGEPAVEWRQRAILYDADEVKKQFNESMRARLPDGVQADFDHFLGLEDYNANLIGIVKVTGNIGSATGKRYFLPGLFFESRAAHPFVAEDKRAIPVDVRYAELVQDDVTYHLPAGYSVESAPQTTSLAWPDRALFKIQTGGDGSTLNVVRTIAYNYTILDPKDYGDLHGFYQKVATADQQPVVLTRGAATATKGN